MGCSLNSDAHFFPPITDNDSLMGAEESNRIKLALAN